MDSPNEPDTEKAITSTPSENLEIEEGTVSSEANSCLGTGLCNKLMPKEGSWRKRAYTILFVALFAVANLTVCSLPAILYLFVPVSIQCSFLT